jgi:hypothetical protein
VAFKKWSKVKKEKEYLSMEEADSKYGKKGVATAWQTGSYNRNVIRKSL